jgi:hypothetical protein
VLALFVDNQNITRILLLDLFIDGKVLLLCLVDLDTGLVAHINSGSYRGEVETHQKRNNIQYMASMHKQG